MGVKRMLRELDSLEITEQMAYDLVEAEDAAAPADEDRGRRPARDTPGFHEFEEAEMRTFFRAHNARLKGARLKAEAP
jgi:hypothetical protein